MNAPVLRWRLGDLLTGERVSVYRLNRELAEAGRTVSRTTLYRLAHEQPERIDLEVAGRVLWGLEKITGKHSLHRRRPTRVRAADHARP